MRASMTAAATMPIAAWRFIAIGRLLDTYVVPKRRLNMEVGRRRYAGKNQQDCQDGNEDVRHGGGLCLIRGRFAKLVLQ